MFVFEGRKEGRNEGRKRLNPKLISLNRGTVVTQVRKTHPGVKKFHSCSVPQSKDTLESRQISSAVNC